MDVGIQRGQGKEVLTHAGAAHGVDGGVRLDTDTLDVDTGSEDVDGGAKVGEPSDAIVSGVDSANSDGVGSGSRGTVAGIHLKHTSQYLRSARHEHL